MSDENFNDKEEKLLFDEVKKLTSGGNIQTLIYKLLNFMRSGNGDEFQWWFERFLVSNKKNHSTEVNNILKILSKYPLYIQLNLERFGHAIILGLIYADGGEKNE